MVRTLHPRPSATKTKEVTMTNVTESNVCPCTNCTCQPCTCTAKAPQCGCQSKCEPVCQCGCQKK